MKSFVLIILFLYVVASCKEKPTYNPFDNQIERVSVKQITKNGCDTINAGCGYFNLIEKGKEFRTYYQVFDDNQRFNKVVAKGFHYSFDSLFIENLPDDYELRKPILDSINALPFDKTKINQALKPFNYQVGNRFTDVHDISRLSIINPEIDDTVIISIDAQKNYETEMVVRFINFFKSKNE